MHNFWEFHGVAFLVFLFVFPRLTMLFGTAVASVFGGPLFWIGWIFAPRITVAVIACVLYWKMNPILCILAWIWALGGESAEKGVVWHQRRR